MESLEKRDYIINKCYKLLLLKGYDGVSISDIQRECGVARGLLYHYFGDKNELFYEIVSRVLLPKFYISSHETFGMNLRETLDYMCTRYYSICLDDGLEGVSLLNFDFLTYRATQESVHIREQYEEVLQQELNVLRVAIEISIRNGEMTTEIGADELAIFTASLIAGTWMNSLYEGDTRELFKRLKTLISIHMRMLNHK